MYVEDNRFQQYYDQEQPGYTIFLKEAVLAYLNKN